MALNNDNNKDTILALWLTNDLSEEELKDFEQENDLDSLKKVVNHVDQMQMPAFDKSKSWASIQAKKTALQEAKPLKSAKIRRLSFVAYAAAAMLLLLVGVFVFNPFANDQLQFETGIAQMEELQLPDGSKAYLSQKSQLSYDPNDWLNNRQVNAAGEVFFEVKKGSTFKVQTDNGVVTVLGTSFKVFSVDDYFEVDCHTGAVAVKAKGDSRMEKLNPNEKVIKHEGTLKKHVFVVDGNKNRSSFKKKPLYAVVSKLEYQFGVKIDQRQIDSQQKFTGTFLHKDLDTALKMVFEPMGMKYTQNGRRIVLKK